MNPTPTEPGSAASWPKDSTILADFAPVPDWPVRVWSAKGQPPEQSKFFRRCRHCAASFIGLSAGKTGERGLWADSRWWCSIECYDLDHGSGAALRLMSGGDDA